ncbi:MAG TPA: amidohydrolase family protein, partial [Thermoanaerobaculia bacterium]|nr:amidohydrolase family protein [Thermoanaerobaculia bacterium]
HPFEGNPKSYRRYLESRPSAAEDAAIELVAGTSARTGARAHIVHLSSAGALDVVRRARDQRVPLTAETTPHYLFFDAERIPDGAPEYKCAPPIREHENRESLWNAVREDLFTAIVSDHSPCVPELKHLAEGNVAAAWGGIASLQFALPIVWTEAQRRGVGLETVSRLMSAGPAALAGLGSRKGTLAVGYDADVIVFAPEESFEVTPHLVRHRHRVTPYTGHRLLGVVKETYLRGVRVEGNAGGTWLRGADLG